MFNLQSLVLGLTIFCNLFLGGMVISKNFRDKTHLAFGAFVLSIIFWTFSILMFQTSGQSEICLLWLRLSYVAAGFIGLTFLAFCLLFINISLPVFGWAIISAVVGLMSILLTRPWFLVRDIAVYHGGKIIITESFNYIIFALYFSIFFFGALVIIRSRRKKEAGLEKKRLNYIFWGVFLAGGSGTFFNLVLPSPWINEWRFLWLGPVFTLIFVIFLAIAIVKHRLMNIRMIGVELLVIAVLVITGVQIFFSRDITELVLEVIIFLILILFSILLVRSILNEVRRREKVEFLSKKLSALNKKLYKLDQAKTNFLSIASHQLRSPLTVIKIGISALLDNDFGKIKPKQSDILKKILESNERLIQLVNDFLNISRIESGRNQYNFTPCDLVRLAKGVVNEFQPKAESKKLLLTFEESGGAPLPAMNLDEEKVRQIIVNLINNAIEYTDKGKIVCRVENDGKEALFLARDTGRGMKPEEMKSIFEKFKRSGSNTAQKQVEGFGFGLFVAKVFVEAHGGKIWAESDGIGRGSAFYFTLPFQPLRKASLNQQQVNRPTA
ncbi:MAG TPA: ATP-binding protein [Patescibacteria group bacterium]|nr:ATP-binding protein [Patescibacteria group bacterium]